MAAKKKPTPRPANESTPVEDPAPIRPDRQPWLVAPVDAEPATEPITEVDVEPVDGTDQ